MKNQYYTHGRQFDYLDYESELKNLDKKRYVKKLFQEAKKDYDLFLAKIKSLGLEIDEYSIEQHENPFLNYYDELLQEEITSKNKKNILSHLTQVDQLNSFFVNSNIAVNQILKDNSSQIDYLLAQFIIYLELTLKILRKAAEERDPTYDSLEEVVTTFDCCITSSGIILKYLLYKIPVDSQRGYNRIFSEKDISWNNNIYTNYIERDRLMDAFEYWKYSKIEITEQVEKPLVDFLDEDFNRAVLTGNFRHKNFMRDLESAIIDDKISRGEIKLEDPWKKIYPDHISNEICTRYFGKENMNISILGIELNKWIDSIHFFQYEAIHFSEKRKENNILSVQNLCIAKTEVEWKKKLINYSKKISEEEAKVIINKLTFCNQSKDLIDAPLVKFQDKLVLLPALTQEIRPLSAILSMFSRENDKKKNIETDFSFKGQVFEERIKNLLSGSNGIVAKRLHVKLDNIDFEREIDVAFVLDRHLFLIECKSFNQPYTVREHAKTNKKIRDAIGQLNKNADYFEENLNTVKEQLGIEENFEIDAVHRVLLTAHTLGEAGQQANVLLTDEASLNGFLLRKPPKLTVIDDSKKTAILLFDNAGIFSGKVTSQKMLAFLKNQPEIERMKRRINKIWETEGTIGYHCCKKNIEDICVDKSLGDRKTVVEA